ncbi:MAG: hypothetical protein COZ12_09105 [Deltaproteobacteria bacterium CG_4_10_14_3_um_filter_60_8]|nr:MAG: hypothetical protein COX17_04520 [Deltaproteobacteria bacterium CG23_combo_of_CG06-09_8_20_14_all_60_8]PIY20545.1 MAG: hypothetical protein COZ12_09105 [Deltaproteobacteria bacterium CG_4_10_14_3_um_filter_60_8]
MDNNIQKDLVSARKFGPEHGFLKAVPVLFGLSDEALTELARLLTKRLFSKDSHVFYQDDRVEHLFFLEFGRIEIYKSDMDGRKLTMWFIQPGDVFCLANLYAQKSFANAMAVVDSSLYCLKRSDLGRFLLAHSELSHSLVQCLSVKLASYSTILDDIAFLNVTSRMAKILLQHKKESAAGQFFCELNQSELAGRLGTCREVVCRTLGRMRAAGVIDTKPEGKVRGVIIRDLKKLADYVQDS